MRQLEPELELQLELELELQLELQQFLFPFQFHGIGTKISALSVAAACVFCSGRCSME